jgi:aspartyl-tRNA(Asn)/glutamyl-tRNA(Gln) amidotransferase subunit A
VTEAKAPRDDLAFRSAAELIKLYARREVSPVEATRAALDRVAAHDEAVNAFCRLDADNALAAARTAESRIFHGQPRGLLDGVPVSIKDVLLTRGLPTLRGSRTTDPDQEWADDAPSVARLREHGAVMIGKTTTPELGWKGVTDSPLTGVTRNPWDPARTAGGSSGGSAAAVALGMAPLSLGTDGGGSVRIPAAFCGVFGFKATYGRVPHYPASPYGTLAHVGPLTWTVEDAALLLDVICGPDSRDWSALPPPYAPFVRGLDDGVAERRIAVSPGLGYADLDPEVAAAVDDCATVLSHLGAHVDKADPGFEDPREAFEVLWFAGAAKAMETIPAEGRKLMDPGLVAAAERGAACSALDYLEATRVRMALGERMGRFHDGYDLLLTAAVPIPAFTAGRDAPRAGDEWTTWTPLTYPFNLTQQPAASVPWGFTSTGLPIGIQLVGRRHADHGVLSAAKALQDARPWQARRPPAPSVTSG